MADFEWFRSFIAIYRHGSITAAAAERFMTQPALSRHLAALEAEIGEPLFVRKPRRVVPTERGKRLYNELVQAIDRLEAISARFRNEAAPQLRIGGPAAFIRHMLAGILPESGYRLSFTFGETGPLLDMLKAHELDVLVSTQYLPARGLTFAKLAEETFLLVASPDEPAVDESRLPESLEERAWIAYGSELPIIRRFWQEAFGTRPNIKPCLVVPDLPMMADLAAHGRGVTILPDYLVRERLARGTLTELWKPPKRAANELWLVFRSFEQSNERFMAWVNRVRSGMPSCRYKRNTGTFAPVSLRRDLAPQPCM